MKIETIDSNQEATLASTVSFKSNLYVVKADSIINDREFLAQIHDPFGLSLMKKRSIRFTEDQTIQYQYASEHCTYAFANDFPWGTVRDENGRVHQVCRCLNRECVYFATCRPDFDESELKVTEENVSFQEKLQEMDAINKGTVSSLPKAAAPIDSQIVASVLYDEPLRSVEAVPVETQSLDDLLMTKPVTKKISNADSGADLTDNTAAAEKIEPVKFPKATFESFKPVEQEDIIRFPETDRTVVNAGPGTGKTWTLIEKLKYMLTEQEVDPENILVLCFSRAAVEVIRERLENAADKDELPMNWHLIEVRTFDSFATYLLTLIMEDIPDLLPRGFVLENQSYDARISAAMDVLKKGDNLLGDYQHIIVDEVQDLVGVRAEMVLALLSSIPVECGFTILGDSCQGIYDYLSEADKTIMSSTDFYKEIFDRFRDANYCSLVTNYRQGDTFGELTQPYRTAILRGNLKDQAEAASWLNRKIKISDIDLKHFKVSDAKRYTQDGTLGILTQTNGQALQISAWLRTEGIPHQLQRPNTSMALAGWVYDVLTNAETDVLDFDEFSEIFEKLYPECNAESNRYWDALISTQRDSTKNNYEIPDLLRGLTENLRDPLLFENPSRQRSKITVSNIHRAKGREFDSVLVLSDLLKGMSEETQDNDQEHKVCYVALTRPKKAIEQVNLETQYIYIEKGSTRRCSKASNGYGKKRKYISHIEVGFEGDLNQRSFAANPDSQAQLAASIQPDIRLKFYRCPDYVRGSIIYRITTEDNENLTLGYTSANFSNGIERALQRIWNNPNPMDIKWFPKIWADIYVNDFTTCISGDGKDIPGARRFGDMYIWKGLAVSGFARIEKDTY